MIDGFLSEGRLVSQSVRLGEGDRAQTVSIETEVWTAVDLRMPVLIRQSSSLGRETRYALTNIRLEEPSADEFRVPSGFAEVIGGKPTLEDVAVIGVPQAASP